MAKLHAQSVNNKGVQKLPGHIWIVSPNSKSENNSTSQTDKSPTSCSLPNPIITDL